MFSVLRAVDRAVNMLQSCQRIAARVGIPISFITSLRIECLTIRLSLKQIKNIITQAEKESLEEIFQADTLEEYNAILESCHLTFYILNKHMSTLELRTIQYTDKAALRAELGALSMNSQMEEVNRAIMGLSHGVRILGTAFEFENSLRATAVLGSPETKRIVSQISRDSVSLQDSFHMETNINETNSQGFEYGDQDCDIDDLLINTTLYRRAFIRNLMRSQPEEIHEPSTPKPAAISDYKQLDDTASRLDGSDYEQLYYTASEPDRSDCEQLYYTASESGSGDMQPDENLLEGLESRSETPKPNADLREIRFDDVNQTMLSEWFQSLQIPVRQLPDEQETFVSIMTPVYTIPSLILNSNIVASDYLLHLNAEETNEDPESLEYPGTFEFSSVSDPKAFSTPAPEDSNPQQDLAQCA
ncbi:hypothetical protein F4805DRAFT_418568 [Annulohypoxylon moriforme]|nr:hypothetical protein F4805DRAFT_418568 [Annulohypoxylon moriforme]